MKKGQSGNPNGRPKGVVNKITADHKALITKSNPIEFLINAFTTGRITGKVNPLHKDSKEQYLTLTFKERCDIAVSLAKKIVPDMKAVEHVDELGNKIIPNITVQFIGSEDKAYVTVGQKTSENMPTPHRANTKIIENIA